MADEGDSQCPLCMDELDLTDKSFVPCTCGYQVCLWCFHYIKQNMNNRCPACRAEYLETSDITTCQKLSTQKPLKLADKKEKMLRKGDKEKDKASVAQDATALSQSRQHLENVRVVQRKLVYVMGLSATIARDDVLRRHDFFGQYGKITKLAINRVGNKGGGAKTNSNGSTTGGLYSAYITFAREEDAVAAIEAVDGCVIDNRTLRATLGTTKYCSYFLRGVKCASGECTFLHDLCNSEDSITREDLAAGKIHSRVRAVLSKAHVSNGNTPTALKNVVSPPLSPAICSPTLSPLSLPTSPPSNPTPTSPANSFSITPQDNHNTTNATRSVTSSSSATTISTNSTSSSATNLPSSRTSSQSQLCSPQISFAANHTSKPTASTSIDSPGSFASLFSSPVLTAMPLNLPPHSLPGQTSELQTQTQAQQQSPPQSQNSGTFANPPPGFEVQCQLPQPLQTQVQSQLQPEPQLQPSQSQSQLQPQSPPLSQQAQQAQQPPFQPQPLPLPQLQSQSQSQSQPLPLSQLQPQNIQSQFSKQPQVPTQFRQQQPIQTRHNFETSATFCGAEGDIVEEDGCMFDISWTVALLDDDTSSHIPPPSRSSSSYPQFSAQQQQQHQQHQQQLPPHLPLSDAFVGNIPVSHFNPHPSQSPKSRVMPFHPQTGRDNQPVPQQQMIFHPHHPWSPQAKIATDGLGYGATSVAMPMGNRDPSSVSPLRHFQPPPPHNQQTKMFPPPYLPTSPPHNPTSMNNLNNMWHSPTQHRNESPLASPPPLNAYNFNHTSNGFGYTMGGVSQLFSPTTPYS